MLTQIYVEILEQISEVYSDESDKVWKVPDVLPLNAVP